MEFIEIFFGNDDDKMIAFVIANWTHIFNVKWIKHPDHHEPSGWAVRFLLTPPLAG